LKSLEAPMRRTLIVASTMFALSAVAWAFPWDTDMADAVYKRAFAWKMMTLPENTISRDHARLVGGRTHPASQRLTGPEPTPADMAEGKRNFDIYCTTCHGADGKGGAAVTDNKSGNRYAIPAPTLSGGQSAVKSRTDGYLFFLIRNGKKNAKGSLTMPGYGYALEDKDVWSLVAYMRSMDGNAAPAPAAAPEAQ
jgi:mono/diheme cytochrome c family protein